MPRSLRPQEIESMLKLTDVRKRYGYCVKQIADWGALYWAEVDGKRCVLGPQADGSPLLPVWPHADFAAAYLERDASAREQWAGAKPVEIPVHDFLDGEVARLRSDNYAIAAFPIPPGKAVVVSLDDFEANLRHELSRIEDE